MPAAVLESTILNTSAKLQVVPLAAGVLLPPTKTLTSVGSAASGATSINATSAGTFTWVEAGTVLSFTGGLLATVTVGTKVLTTSTAIPVAALAATIGSGLTATLLGYASVFGCKDFSWDKADTTVDTTEYQDGYGESSRIVSRKYSATLEVFGITNNRALEGVIKPCADTPGTYIYALLTNSVGDTYAGPVDIRNFQEKLQKADVYRCSFLITFIGDPTITRIFVP
jgi:hypothetical protein